MGFNENTYISCTNETCAICLPRVLKLLFGRGSCDESRVLKILENSVMNTVEDRVMSLCLEVGTFCNFDGIGVGAAVWCDGV